jgi:peptidoglycan/LPS O-acetylase OafA/YrhL
VALAARTSSAGFDPYNLQIAVLMAIVMFGVLITLNRIDGVPHWIAAPTRLLASYSYSLYLIHNTVLVIVFERTQSLPKPVSIVIGVIVAQLTAWLVYLAFERHYRSVSIWLRPVFLRWLRLSAAAGARLRGENTHPGIVLESSGPPRCSTD